MVLAQFASGAGNAFTVTGPAEGHDSALINAGINVQWTPTIGTYFGYNGQMGPKGKLAPVIWPLGLATLGSGIAPGRTLPMNAIQSLPLRR
jgi:Autotransporter beta-domain